MPTDQKVLERNVAKVLAALDGADRTAAEIEAHTGLNWSEVDRTVNYLKSQRRIEHRDGLLHLRPADETPALAESSADPAAQAASEPAPAVAAPADPPAAPKFKIVTLPPDQRRARIADLRADERIQGLIAARRADYPDAFMPAPRIPFGKANHRQRDAGGTAWFAPDAEEMTPFAVVFPGGDVRIQNSRVFSQGRGRPTGTAAYRQQRLDKYDKATLLRAVRTANRNEPIFADLVAAAIREESRATIAERDEQIEQLTSEIETLKAEKAAAPRAGTPEWYDAHTLVYTRVGWPKLDENRQKEIAVALLNEIVQPPRQRNNAWLTIVALNEKKEAQ